MSPLHFLLLLQTPFGCRRAFAEEPACAEGDARCGVIVVTAARTGQHMEDTIAPISVITRAEIEASGASTLQDVLRTSGQVDVTTTQGGAALSLQGLDPEHTLILMNGRPLAGRVDGTLDVSRIPVDQVERIEILPGPASALYGSEALGGVINVVMRRDFTDSRVDADVRVGSRSMAEASAALAGQVGRLDGGVSADRQADGGWDDDPAVEGTSGDERLSWGGRAWGAWSPSSRVSLDVDGDYRLRDAIGVEATAAGAVFDHRALEESANSGVALRYWNGARMTGRLQVAGALWRQQFLNNQRDSEVQDSYEVTWDQRAYANGSWQWAPDRHLLVVGVDSSYEELRSDRLESGVAARSRVALYAQDDWGVARHPRFGVSPGGRVDVDSQFGVHATPHLSLRVDPLSALSLRLTGGQGYRAPEFKELYLDFNHSSYGYELYGNPDLQPETSTGATVAAHVRAANLFVIDVEGWWNEIKNLIDPELTAEGTSGTSALYAYENVGRAVTRGGRATASFVRSGPISASAGYTYTDARNREDGGPLDGRSAHRVNGSLAVRPLPVLEASTTVAWNSSRPYTSDDTTVLAPAYAWVDARLAWTALPGVRLEAGARNVLNVRDEYLNLPPRTFYVGVRAGGTLRPTRPSSAENTP